MSPSARLLRRFGGSVPVVGAPLAHVAGGRLAAAVTRAGGLGFIGAGYGDLGWLDCQLAIAQPTPVGVGLITWVLDEQPDLLGAVLERGVRHVWLSFGDPSAHLPMIRAAGAIAWCQVQTTGDAAAAAGAGADVIVAQGDEAGGHGRSRTPLMTLLPDVVAEVGDGVAVVAAGGIATPSRYRWALDTGAAGVALGTRLYASEEALDLRHAKAALVSASSADTIRTTVFDLVRRPTWPPGYDGRALRNRTTDRWHGNETELTTVLDDERARYRAAVADADLTHRVVWAGTSVDDIHHIATAADAIRHITSRA